MKTLAYFSVSVFLILSSITANSAEIGNKSASTVIAGTTSYENPLIIAKESHESCVSNCKIALASCKSGTNPRDNERDIEILKSCDNEFRSCILSCQ